MTKILQADVRDFLRAFHGAIKLDQIHVDALPVTKFRPLYNDHMWPQWREGHIRYINRLFSTVDAIPAMTLDKLNRDSDRLRPETVGNIVLELFADSVSNDRTPLELATADQFLDCLIRRVGEQPEAGARQSRASQVLHRDVPMAVRR